MSTTTILTALRELRRYPELAVHSSTAFNAASGVKNLHFNEFTITYQRTLASYLLTRFEYRRDMSDYFPGG